jgi:hypothetical protein
MAKFNLTEILFIIGSILIGVFGILHFFNNKQYIALLLFVPLVVWVLVIFGLRWFGPDSQYKNTTVKWPPFINTCPDFLIETVHPGTKTKACVDPTGVATGSLMIYPKGGTTDAAAFFDIDPAETRDALCARLKEKGLTWEGIYDGQTCFTTDGSGGNNSDDGKKCKE